MSLKLDELRKRLLQQQAGIDAGSADTAPATIGGRVLGAPVQKTPEAPASPKGFESLAPKKAPAGEKAPEILVYKTKPTEPIVEAAQPESQRAEHTEPASEPKVGSRELKPETDAVAAQPATPSAVPVEPVGNNELAAAVAKVFEQTKAVQARLEELNRIFDSIDRAGNSAARAFGPLRGFQKQMAQLAKSFEPMRTFQAQLSEIAQNFEPMKALEDQLSRLADSFQSHIADLIKALEPAKELRERIRNLSATFDEASELQEQFGELYEAFQLSPASNGKHVNGLDAHGAAGS